MNITPEEIGVPANNYVRKKELIATGKFDESALASYTDNEFVLLKIWRKVHSLSLLL